MGRVMTLEEQFNFYMTAITDLIEEKEKCDDLAGCDSESYRD